MEMPALLLWHETFGQLETEYFNSACPVRSRTAYPLHGHTPLQVTY